MLSGVIVGIFSSYIASKIFQKNNNNTNRPNIQISPQLIKVKKNSENKEGIEVKLINYTNQDLSGIVIELDGLKNLSGGQGTPLFRIQQIATKKILNILKYDKTDSINYHNVHRIILRNDDILTLIAKFDTIRLSVFATCPYYGTAITLTQSYNKKEILDETYHFNLGDNFNTQEIET